MRILATALLLAAGIDASAQDYRGNIYGRIVDPAKAPITGVSITVEGAAIMGKRTTESEANGSYRFLYLPPGEYRVTYRTPGFKTLVYERETVELGKTLTRNVTMRIAEVDEAVVVTGRSPIVDVRSATVSTIWGATFLRDIPNQRDLFGLLAQTPGITMLLPDIGGNTVGTQPSYRVYGMDGQSSTTVDGVKVTTLRGDPYTDFSAMAEAKVSGAGNSAEFAVAGAAVSTVIKSGSNTLHGEAFAEGKSGEDRVRFGAENYPESYRQYRDVSAQLGGPFLTDRLWYFASFRNHYTAFRTSLYDKPAMDGGTQGHRFTTETSQFTIKLNYHLRRQSTLTFMTQVNRKFQPYRNGSGPTAYYYSAESTARQDSWSEIGKVSYMRVLNNRATLDTSVNVYANQFPLTAHTDRTPIHEESPQAWRGAYNRPTFWRDRRWHYDANLTLYADRHDMKIGYMYVWYAPQVTEFGAPGPAGTAEHFYISTTGGFPTAFWTDNGPVSSENTLRTHSLFFQDKFQVAPRLTLDYGIRYDQYHSSYPEQGIGSNGNTPCVDDSQCDVGPFAVRTVTPARHVVTFNAVVPRGALIYDVFGNAKTALKASWGRYAMDPSESIAAMVNPVNLISTKYAWDTNYLTWEPAVAATRITPAYVTTLQPISGGAQLTPADVDQHLKDSYTDEFTFGVEQEIASDLRANVAFVRKQVKNMFGMDDRLRPSSAYRPVPAIDPGPDANPGSADDRRITVYETDVPAGTTDYYLTNKAIGNTYTTVEFVVTKRMRNRWQLLGGVDWTKRDLASEFSENPNTVFWGSNNTQTTGWTGKASGSYLFRWGIMVACGYSVTKGAPYGRTFTVTHQYLTLADPQRTTPLIQGSQGITADKVGTYYLPTISVLNMRVQKEFVIKDAHRLHLMVNIFNLGGVKTVIDVDERTGLSNDGEPLFGRPMASYGGTVFRFGMRYTF